VAIPASKHTKKDSQNKATAYNITATGFFVTVHVDLTEKHSTTLS